MSFGSFERGRDSSSTLSEINMVPLIDVMLVLLVIFIITAPLLSHSLKINVPQASSEPVQREPLVVDVAIDERGQLFWNEQPVSMRELDDLFASQAALDPQPDVRIRADSDTRYEMLAQVMSSARRTGLKRLGFVTRPDANAGPAGGSAATGTH